MDFPALIKQHDTGVILKANINAHHLLPVLLVLALPACGITPIGHECFLSADNCKTRAERDADAVAWRAERLRQDLIDKERAAEEARLHEQRHAAYRRWLQANPDEYQRILQQAAKDASTLNVYGCPSNMIPLGVSQGGGCGYWTGLRHWR